MFGFALKPRSGGRSYEYPQIIIILCASLCGVSSGLLLSWTSPAIPELVASNTTSITLEEASYFTVIPPIGLALASPVGAVLLDRIGRKRGLMLTAVAQLLSWILTGVADNIWVFYVARFFAGIGDALMYINYLVYVCEIAQPKVRGTWGTLTASSGYLGVFLVNVIGVFNTIKPTALICGILPIIMLIVFSMLPESPYYSFMKGRDQEAKETLQILYWRIDVDDEFTMLKDDVARQISEEGTWKELFTIGSNRTALLMSSVSVSLVHLSGFSAFEMYTQYTFQQAGKHISQQLSAIIVSSTLAATTILLAFIVEKFGRRPLLIISCFGCGIVLTIETIYFCIVQFTNIDVSDFNWLPLAGMALYMVISAIGIGTIPILMCGELFSTSIKGKAACTTNIIFASGYIIVPKLFQTLTDNFGIYAPFCFFATSCILGGIFCCFYLIETKGKTLEKIQQELSTYRISCNK